MSTKTRYTTDLLDVPGMQFRIDVDDPKERIQAYIDEYANPVHPQGHDEVSQPASLVCGPQSNIRGFD